MKSAYSIVILLLMASLSYAQSPNEISKLKVKASQKRMRYHLFPELARYDDYKTFNFELTEQGIEPLIMSSNSALNPDLLYTKRILGGEIMNKHGAAGHFTVKINRLKKTQKGRKTEKRQAQGQPAYYIITFDRQDQFEIQLVDNKKGGEILMDTVITIDYESKFPNDYIGSKKYSSSKLVEEKYKDFQKEAGMKKRRSGTLKGAFKSEDFLAVFNGKMGSTLKLVFLQVPNIKEKKTTYFADFNRIEEIYEEVLDLLPGGLQAHDSKNFHNEKVFKLMNEAHELLLPFDNEKYYSAIEDAEERQEFIHLLRYNLFLSSFATSRYGAARKYMELMAKDLGREFEQLKSFRPTKYSQPKQKYAFLAARDFYDLLIREEHFYDLHKEEYGYFK